MLGSVVLSRIRATLLLQTIFDNDLWTTPSTLEKKPKGSASKDDALKSDCCFVQCSCSPKVFQSWDFWYTVRNNWVSTRPCLCSNFSIFNVSWQMLKVMPQLNTLTHLYHIWELSNEVLYDSIPQVVSKIWLVKLEKSKFA